MLSKFYDNIFGSSPNMSDRSLNIIVIVILCIIILVVYFKMIKGYDFFEQFSNKCPQKNIGYTKYPTCNSRIIDNNLPNKRIYFGPIINSKNINCSNYLISPNNLDKKYSVRDVCHGIKEANCSNFRNISLMLFKHYKDGINRFNPNYKIFNPV
jgi:hypothetical protein